MREASNRFLATVFGLVLIHAGGLTPVAAGELPGLRLTLEHGQFFPKDSVNPGLSQEPAEELDGPRDLGWIAGSFEFAPGTAVPCLNHWIRAPWPAMAR